jgi:hypothetical protein
MRMSIGWTGALGLVVSAACASLQTDAARPRPITESPCFGDTNYERLAFWVGDWDVYDSTGARYATQRVHSVLGGCAIAAEWTGSGGNKGMNVSAFDRRTNEWRQIYMSNQLPSPSGVTLRKSDSTYKGLGVRFIPLFEPADGNRARSRVTILPVSGDVAMQLFEDSSDGGETWCITFKAEHRLRSGRQTIGMTAP